MSLSILFCGIRKPPLCTPFTDIFLTTWLAPSLANPAKADNPKVFAIVGPNVCPRARIINCLLLVF